LREQKLPQKAEKRKKNVRNKPSSANRSKKGATKVTQQKIQKPEANKAKETEEANIKENINIEVILIVKCQTLLILLRDETLKCQKNNMLQEQTYPTHNQYKTLSSLKNRSYLTRWLLVCLSLF
jgi:hypothetical protein